MSGTCSPYIKPPRVTRIQINEQREAFFLSLTPFMYLLVSLLSREIEPGDIFCVTSKYVNMKKTFAHIHHKDSLPWRICKRAYRVIAF